MKIDTTRLARRAGGALAVAALAGTAVVATSASAAPRPNVATTKGTYHVVGTSTVKKTGSSLKLGPALLTIHLANSGKFTGALPLKPATTSFKIGGAIPVSATVSFIPVGPLTGSVGFKKKIVVQSTAKEILRLSNVKAGGVPTPVGKKCQTATPVVLHVANPGKFDLDKGGALKGTFTIPKFANCGVTTPIINSQVPGPGNAITLNLSHGRLNY